MTQNATATPPPSSPGCGQRARVMPLRAPALSRASRAMLVPPSTRLALRGWPFLRVSE